MTIGQVARETGISASAIRYYERFGLLKPSTRTDANYRVYGEAAKDRLRFIRSAQSAGFTLDDIRQLLEFRDGSTSPCEEIQTLIDRRLSDVGSLIGELRNVQRVLRAFLRACLQTELGEECPVLDKIKLSAATTFSTHHRSPPRPEKNR